jgi:hypothetical protein
MHTRLAYLPDNERLCCLSPALSVQTSATISVM